MSIEDEFESIFFNVGGPTLRTLTYSLLNQFDEDQRLEVLQVVKDYKDKLPAVLTIDTLPEEDKWRVEAMLPRNVTSDQLYNFQFTDESLYSVTQSYHRNLINGWIRKWIQQSDSRPVKDLVITDATAHVGGDSIGFGLEGYGKVMSVEISYLTFNILIENLELFGLSSQNVLYGSYLDFYKDLKQDIIFIDAPWGGKSVMDKTDVSLMLGDVDLNDLALDILEHSYCKVLVLKVPPGYKSVDVGTSSNYVKDDREIKTKEGKVKFRVIGYYIKGTQRHSTGGPTRGGPTRGGSVRRGNTRGGTLRR